MSCEVESPSQVRVQLNRLGHNIENLENSFKFLIEKLSCVLRDGGEITGGLDKGELVPLASELDELSDRLCTVAATVVDVTARLEL